MAHISYSGRVIGQPELKFSQAGKAYLRFRTVENTRKQIDGEWKDVGAAWRDVTVFGRDAETLAEALNDKDTVLVQGRLDCRDWEKDGRKGTSFDVVADHVAIKPRAQQSSTGFAQPPGQPAMNTGWQKVGGPASDPWATQAPADTPPF